MKKYGWALRVAGSLILGLGLLSCTSFSSRQTKDQNKVEAAHRALLTNQLGIAQQAGQVAFATGAALNQASNDPPVALARNLNERVQLLLGPPELKDALQLRQMVDDLLSEQLALHTRGQEELTRRDALIGQLQKQKGSLEQKLSAIEQHRDQDYQQAAGAADKWQRLVSWFHRILWGAGIFLAGLVGINLAALAYPPILPLASLVNHLTGGIFGGLFGLVFRLLPEARTHAGVVSKQDHQDLEEENQITEKTLTHLVSAIEEIKKTKPDAYQLLRPEILQTTSQEVSRPKINAVRSQLGYV